MQTKKRLDYSRAQEKKIKEVKDGPNRNIELEALANQFNRTRAAMYQKWTVLTGGHKKAKRTGRSKSHATKTLVTASVDTKPIVTPYVLEIGAGPPARNDHSGMVNLKKNLKPVLESMEPYSVTTPHSVSVHKTERNTIRKWLSKDKLFKRKAFTMTPVLDRKGKPTDFVRIYRKI